MNGLFGEMLIWTMFVNVNQLFYKIFFFSRDKKSSLVILNLIFIIFLNSMKFDIKRKKTHTHTLIKILFDINVKALFFFVIHFIFFKKIWNKKKIHIYDPEQFLNSPLKNNECDDADVVDWQLNKRCVMPKIPPNPTISFLPRTPEASQTP